MRQIVKRYLLVLIIIMLCAMVGGAVYKAFHVIPAGNCYPGDSLCTEGQSVRGSMRWGFFLTPFVLLNYLPATLGLLALSALVTYIWWYSSELKKAREILDVEMPYYPLGRHELIDLKEYTTMVKGKKLVDYDKIKQDDPDLYRRIQIAEKKADRLDEEKFRKMGL